MSVPAYNKSNARIRKVQQDVPENVPKETSKIIDEALGQILGSADKQNFSRETDFLGLKVDETFGEEERNKQRKVDLSRVRELQSEIERLRIEKIVRELQRKIMLGEMVYLENYPEIPIEQKQVLKAQIEAMRQREMLRVSSQNRLQEPSTRPSRKFFGFGGSRKHVEDLQRATETRLPPSG